MPDTVLVAAPECLPALQEQGDFGDALAFSDADALKALEAITRDRPKVIALETQFAATSRGAALIKRIKADPKLRKCEIRVVSLEGESEEFSQSDPALRGAETEAAVKLDQRGIHCRPVNGHGIPIRNGGRSVIHSARITVDQNGRTDLSRMMTATQVSNTIIGQRPRKPYDMTSSSADVTWR